MTRRIGRREFVTLLASTAAWPFAARAQQPERMRRIGVLMGLVAQRPRGTIARGRIRKPPAGAGMGQGAQPFDRVSLGRRRKRVARPRGRAALHTARPDLSQHHPSNGRDVEAEPGHTNRVHAGERSGWPRLRIKPGASGRQSHGLHQL
jgi:hypothetical protein